MTLACVKCRSKKIKCDRLIPCCSPCLATGSVCEYVARHKQRAVDQELISKLKARVRTLEKENNELKNTSDHPHSLHSSSPDFTSRSSRTASPGVSREIGSVKVDEVTSVASYISMSAAGDTKYLGSSSGVLFAGIVNATLASAGKRPPLADIPLRSGEVHRLLAHDSPAQFYHNNMGLHLDEKEFDEDGVEVNYFKKPQAPLPAALKLVNIYFGHSQIIYPILNQEEFMITFHNIYQDPKFYEQNPYAAFLYDMVLAIASIVINRNQYVDGTRKNKYLIAALQKLSMVMCQDGFKSLVAILMLAVYSLLHEISAGVWQLVGIAIRLCLELGLNNELGENLGLHDPDYFEVEMKRRLFWVTFTLDRVVSVTSGRPLGLQDSDITVSMPSTHSDKCLFDSHFEALKNRDLSYDQTAQVSCGCPSTTCFVQVLKIRSLNGIISRLFYTKRYDKPTEQHIKMKHSLKVRLAKWHDDILKMGMPNQNSKEFQGGAGSCFAELSWYEILYYNAKSLLSRPSLVFPVIDETDLLDVLEAASGSLRVYAYLSQTRKLSYTWLSLHSVFMAGISYLYSIGKLMYYPGALSKLPSNVAIFEETRSCSNLLTSMCERWNLSPEARTLFDKLSAQVMNEFMEQKLKHEISRRLDIPYQDSLTEQPAAEETKYISEDPTIQHIFGEKFSELESIFEGQVDGFATNKHDQPATIHDLFEGLGEYEEFIFSPSLNFS